MAERIELSAFGRRKRRCLILSLGNYSTEIAGRNRCSEWFVVHVPRSGHAVANQYADNLLNFLHALQARLANATFTISCGDPKRDKDHRAALFGAKKSDPIEAGAAARFALSEQPAPVKMRTPELRALRQVASRLQAVVRQRTRFINQFHLLLSLTFPELAVLVQDIASNWVLTPKFAAA